MPTTAQIVDDAFSAVAEAMPDVILTLTIERAVLVTYDPATGGTTDTPFNVSGRAVFDDMDAPAHAPGGADVFPGYTLQPGDQVFYCDVAIQRGDAVTFARPDTSEVRRTGTVYEARDLLGTGAMYVGIVR